MIKMTIKGRSPTMRPVSKTDRVALDWFFDRINLDPKIQIKIHRHQKPSCRHSNQGNFTRDEWNHLLFDRTNLDSKNQIRDIDTKHQHADIMTSRCRLWPNRLWPTLIDRFWPTFWVADFGQADFGQNWCSSLLAFFFSTKKKQDEKKAWKPFAAPKGGARKGGSQNFALFFFLSRHHFAFFLSLWVSSRGNLVVFEAPGP